MLSRYHSSCLEVSAVVTARQEQQTVKVYCLCTTACTFVHFGPACAGLLICWLMYKVARKTAKSLLTAVLHIGTLRRRARGTELSKRPKTTLSCIGECMSIACPARDNRRPQAHCRTTKMSDL